jgi:uncharacterized alkaline shock family protein YloU
MTEKNNPSGSIFISHRAIATIASRCTLESYGVVGLTAKNLTQGFTNAIVKDPLMGVNIIMDGSGVIVDLFIIIEFGTRIKSVAANLSELVKYQIEQATGLTVSEVNVHVKGLRISNTD